MKPVFVTFIGTACAGLVGGLILAVVIVNTVGLLPSKPIIITTGSAR